MEILVISLVCLLATCVQGVSGMGFGLVTVPFFVALVGAHYGIVWSNFSGGLVALVLLVAMWKDVNWRRFVWLFAASLPALVGFVLILRFVPERVFAGVIGVFMLLSVAFSFISVKFKPVPLRPASLVAGFLAGMMSALVAQSGPVMAAYAQATRCGQREFAATNQPLFLSFNIFVVGGKLLYGGQPEAFTAFPPFAFLTIVLAVIVGALLSKWLAKIVKPKWARNLALLIATVGAIRVLVGLF
ncbi:sulfite exporter TauE/SafE family protein [Mobiluncus porci]|uniref:Probable membrane transporter protein n=1 Tax=Mobiluncus porci TaxID=2652278 RepID=A0A7K0K3G1_9ACTO|nr:sulfite exporter TauE/SafE family protein [Mobiluncus porci]MST49958.1 sulfite exporter TauE/SafE family protein [Mobiluncus porci]